MSSSVVVITGASRGLGRGLAEHFAAQGLRLGLCARTEPEPLGESVCASVDVTDAAAVRAFRDQVAERFGRIDLWINNAGVLEPIAFVRALTPEALRGHLEINVIGVLNGTQAYVEQLARQEGGGVLMNVSSGAALKGYAGWGAYCAGKAAVDRLTECVQIEEEETGLRAYSVAPGVIDTDMQALIRSKSEEEFPAVQRFRDMKRDASFSSPEHVAKHLLAMAFDPAARPEAVVCRVEPEH